jgi:CubicO group peptidase (beta-lactamase class C family)
MKLVNLQELSKMMINKKLLIITAVTTALFSTTALGGSVSKYRTTGGNAVEYRNVHIAPGNGTSYLIPFNENDQTSHDSKSADKAQRMVERNQANLTALLINKGRIVFESYRAPAKPSSKMHSMSMSKTLTALVIGNLLCDGKIRSLDDLAEVYAPRLKGTLHGKTTIRNLLMMASGSAKNGANGQPKPNAYRNIKNQRVSGLELIKGLTKDRKQGTYFQYNSADTLSLSEITNTFGGLIRNFDYYIWSQIGPEIEGSWMVDYENNAVAFAGFSASLKDWGRLGMYTIDMVKGRGGVCMQEFTTEMNSKLIKNKWKKGKPGYSFSDYGYQTWIMQNGNAWWVGYGGQRVGLNFELEKVMVVHSSTENYLQEAHDVFNYFADWD